MSSKIDKLTPEQEALILIYREKWRKIALKTGRCNRNKVIDSIDSAYAAVDLYKPRLVFFDSPYTGLGKLDERLENLSKLGVTTVLHKQWKKTCVWEGNSWDEALISSLWKELERQLERQISRELYKQLDENLRQPLTQQFRQIEWHLYRQMENDLYAPQYLKLLDKANKRDNSIFTDITPLQELFELTVKYELLSCYGSLFDFCITVLSCTCDTQKWEAYQMVVENCGWFTPFGNIAIVCERPLKICFDNEFRLHAESKPAIQFADGYSVYANQGVRLPEKYGKLHPQQWKPEWLLQEYNAQIVGVLTKGIGYERIAKELEAIELDSYQEYTLLKINSNFIDTIYLLKMTCPSTGLIHFLRVPSTIKSAREAICWVNWGIDPEDFSVQT